MEAHYSDKERDIIQQTIDFIHSASNNRPEHISDDCFTLITHLKQGKPISSNDMLSIIEYMSHHNKETIQLSSEPNYVTLQMGRGKNIDYWTTILNRLYYNCNETPNISERLKNLFSIHKQPPIGQFRFSVELDDTVPSDFDLVNIELEEYDIQYENGSPIIAALSAMSFSLDKLMFYDKTSTNNEISNEEVYVINELTKCDSLDEAVQFHVMLSQVDRLSIKIQEHFVDNLNIEIPMFAFSIAKHIEDELTDENEIEIDWDQQVIYLNEPNQNKLQIPTQSISDLHYTYKRPLHGVTCDNDMRLLQCKTSLTEQYIGLMDWDRMWNTLDKIDCLKNEFISSEYFEQCAQDALDNLPSVQKSYSYDY